jgi:RNA polymerase sigma factor (sigma-70 family)
MDTPLSLFDRLCQPSNAAAWQQLNDLYQPLIRRWLLRDSSLAADVDDLTQEVLAVLFQELPRFRHNRRKGAFRKFLRQIIHCRVLEFCRARGQQPVLLQHGSADSQLMDLEDPRSDLSRQWDEEHNLHVMRKLMELIEPESAWRSPREIGRRRCRGCR